MKIERISVKNYRTLESVDLTFPGYFSSISGRNNAGKTSVVSAIRSIFNQDDRDFDPFEEDFSYSSVLTQWVASGSSIELEFIVSVSLSSDPGLHNFIKKIANLDELEETLDVVIKTTIKPENEKEISIFISGNELEKYETSEIYRRFSSSSVVVFHNSTSGHSRMFSPRGAVSFHEMMLSKTEKDELKKEQDRIRKKIRKYAQEQRLDLSKLLGRLEEKYEVELTMFDGMFRNSIPLGINLKDKGVEVPLDEWGSGTQNRTRIMMSILNASRIKQQNDDENRVTPIIIVEEPESFLHPSAQAEFGRVIRGLAKDLGVQIIITTHSPYMLCQEDPQCNILLDRKLKRGKLKEAEVVPITENRWMEPFGIILGLNDESVAPWSEVVRSSLDDAILVEGDIDKEYLEYISGLEISGFKIPDGVEIIAYGGKDALKNTIMLKFVIEKFDRVFITFDQDAKHELLRPMTQLGLTEKKEFLALGVNKDGKDCIEGIVPQRILSKVHGENTDLIMKLTSTDSKKRKSAKNELKRLVLDEFKKTTDIKSEELKGFKEFYTSVKKTFKQL